MEKNIYFIHILLLLVKVKSGLLPVFLMGRKVGVPYVEGTIMAPVMVGADVAKLINISMMLRILVLTDTCSIC